MSTLPRGAESDSPVSAIPGGPGGAARPSTAPQRTAQGHLTAALPEQNHEISDGTTTAELTTQPENDHQCGYEPLLAQLHAMIVNLQIHIDRRTAEAAAPRIGAALNRIADAEHARALALQSLEDLRRDTDRTIAALRRRTAAAERMVLRCLTALQHRDDTRVPPAQRAAWNAGFQACADATAQALNSTTAPPREMSPAEYERQAIDNGNPDYHG